MDVDRYIITNIEVYQYVLYSIIGESFMSFSVSLILFNYKERFNWIIILNLMLKKPTETAGSSSRITEASRFNFLLSNPSKTHTEGILGQW